MKFKEDLLPLMYFFTFLNQIQIVFQGEDIIDPVQPSKEEIDELIKNWQKVNKGKKDAIMPDYTKPKMLTPAPVIYLQLIKR